MRYSSATLSAGIPSKSTLALSAGSAVAVHNIYELYAAVVVNIIAVILKFGDRTQIGALQLATSLVATIQLVAAAFVWVIVTNDGGDITAHQVSAVVSLSGGALLANIVSLFLLVGETLTFQRR